MAKKKKEMFLYKGKKYEVLERANGRVKLTDGVIHFWVKDNVDE